MLEAVKINAKLSALVKVSPALVDSIIFIGGGGGLGTQNAINVSSITVPTLLFFSLVNELSLVLWQLYADFDTPLAQCHTLWPRGTNMVTDYSFHDNTKSLEFCLGTLNQIA